MSFRFRKSVKIAPGVRLNLSKSGVSTSLGTRGATVNIGKKGVRSTVGIPGTGLSHTMTHGKGRKASAPRATPAPAAPASAPEAQNAAGWKALAIVLALILLRSWSSNRQAKLSFNPYFTGNRL